MEITERPPTRFDLPGRAEPVYIASHIHRRRRARDHQSCAYSLNLHR